MFRVQSIVLIKRQSKSSMVLWSLFSNMFFSDMPIVEEVHTYKRVRRRIYVLGFFFFIFFLHIFTKFYSSIWASLLAQTVKNLPAIWETWVWSSGWKDPLDEGRATHSSILAWRIPVDRGAWWTIVQGVTKSQTQLSD